MRRQATASAILLVAFVAQQPAGCDPATSASKAGDGATQFGNAGQKDWVNQGATGKLKWNTTYNAHKQQGGDVEHCEWKVYTINTRGVMKVLKTGNYANAKIKVAEPDTVQVFLKSLHCGLWED